jgi:hypothetical protein
MLSDCALSMPLWADGGGRGGRSRIDVPHLDDVCD